MFFLIFYTLSLLVIEFKIFDTLCRILPLSCAILLSNFVISGLKFFSLYFLMLCGSIISNTRSINRNLFFV